MMDKQRKYKEILGRLSGKRIVVIGDLMADRYILGMTSRVSREAPVLILKYDSEIVVPGGAGNAVTNLKAMGGYPVPLGVVGDDEMGLRLIEILNRSGVETNNIIVEPGAITTTKTRILAGGQNTTKQQVIRIDRDPERKPLSESHDRIFEALRRGRGEWDALIVSDYSLGVVNDAICEEIVQMAREDAGIITVDSRRSILKFHHVTAVTPNEEEVEAALGICLDDGTLENAGRSILQTIQPQGVLITRGRKGMALFQPKRPTLYISIHGTDQIADVTGAGDTVIAAFTLGLAAGADMVDASRLANIAGGLVVMKRGTATVSIDELYAAVDSDLGVHS
jgi:rfaE bifunctional protein kinase chain/domain